MTFVPPSHHDSVQSNPLKRPAAEMLDAKAPLSPGYPSHNKRRQPLSPTTNLPSKRKNKSPLKPRVVPRDPLQNPDAKIPPFYGLQTVAETFSRFIMRAFHSSSYISPTNSRTYPTLPEFIAYVIRKANVSTSVHTATMIYLNRLALRHPGRTAVHGHRLFFTAFVIAVKHVQEAQHDNTAWARLSMGMFDVKTVNQMEKEMLSALEWELGVDARTVTDFDNALKRDYGADRPIEEYPALYPDTFITPRRYASSGAFRSNISVLVPGQASIAAIRMEKERTEKVKEMKEAALMECSDRNAMVVESFEIGDSLKFSMVAEKWGVDDSLDIRLRDQCFVYAGMTTW